MRLGGAGSRPPAWRITSPRRAALSMLGAILLAGLVASAAAAEASPQPTQRLPTCTERYPDEGPAGLDLRLACVVTEILGAYTGLSDAATPPRISDWLRPLGLMVAGLVLVWVAWRGIARRVGHRLAPVAPSSWWSCPGCRSLNPTGTTACYHCRQPWTREAMTMTATDEPGAD